MKTGSFSTPEKHSVEDLIVSTVAAARTGDYSGTSRLLNRFLGVVQQELAGNGGSGRDLRKIAYSLETLCAMQRIEDWVAFADILEYEFAPLWGGK